MTDITIASLKSKRQQPYDNLAIKARIVKVGHTAAFSATDGTEKKILNFSIADDSGTILASLNDTSKFRHVKEGATLTFKNFVLKGDKLAMHAGTRLRRVADVIVPSAIVEQGKQLICPASPSKSIADIHKTCKQRDIVTVSGQVMKDEAKRTVMVGTAAVPTELRTVTLSHDGTDIEVTLWRDLVNKAVTLGSFVQINSCVVGSWQQKTTLNSTRLSTIEETEAPQTEEEGEIVSYLVAGEKVEVEIETATCTKDFTIPLETLSAALNILPDHMDNDMADMLPIPVCLTVKGADVLHILKK